MRASPGITCASAFGAYGMATFGVATPPDRALQQGEALLRDHGGDLAGRRAALARLVHDDQVAGLRDGGEHGVVSNGTSVRGSMTSALTPSSARVAAAASAGLTIRPMATTVTASAFPAHGGLTERDEVLAVGHLALTRRRGRSARG